MAASRPVQPGRLAAPSSLLLLLASALAPGCDKTAAHKHKTITNVAGSTARAARTGPDVTLRVAGAEKLATIDGDATGIATDDGNVYVARHGMPVVRVPKAQGATPVVLGDELRAGAIRADGAGHLYAIVDDAVVALATDGSRRRQRLAAVKGGLVELVDATHVYFVSHTPRAQYGQLARVPKAGGAPEVIWADADDVDVKGGDADAVYFTVEDAGAARAFRWSKQGGAKPVPVKVSVDADAWCMGFSAGRWIVLARTGALYAIPAEGGAPTEVNQLGPRPKITVAGPFVYYGAGPTETWRARIDGGKPEQVATLREGVTGSVEAEDASGFYAVDLGTGDVVHAP